MGMGKSRSFDLQFLHVGVQQLQLEPQRKNLQLLHIPPTFKARCNTQHNTTMPMDFPCGGKMDRAQAATNLYYLMLEFGC